MLSTMINDIKTGKIQSSEAIEQNKKLKQKRISFVMSEIKAEKRDKLVEMDQKIQEELDYEYKLRRGELCQNFKHKVPSMYLRGFDPSTAALLKKQMHKEAFMKHKCNMCDDKSRVKKRPKKLNPNLSGRKLPRNEVDPAKELLLLRFNTSSNRVKFIPSLPTLDILESQ